MPSNDLAIRFTDLKYATKSEVIKDLRTNLIDNIWKNIITYRQQYRHDFNLNGIDKTRFYICLAPSISKHIEKIAVSLNDYKSELKRFDNNETDKNYLEKKMKLGILASLSQSRCLVVDDNYLRMVVDHSIKDESSEYSILQSYLSCLEEIPYFSSFDIDSIAQIYMKLSRNFELTSLYRTESDTSSLNKVLIDRIYNSAPTQLIEPMMENLFQFLNEDDSSSIVKCCVIYFFINYIKPFPSYNEEMALLLTKLFFNVTNKTIPLSLLNLENILVFDQEGLKKRFDEVQKSNDVTYLFVRFIDDFFRIVNGAIDLTIHFSVSAIKQEYFDSKKDDIKEQKVVDILQAKPEKMEKPVIKTDQLAENKKISLKEKDPNEGKLAISSLPSRLNEEQAKLLEEDLLESDPCLKKGQAFFFARHCTIGKRYTIAQYKKALGCVYETARYSMDSLADLGYYRREMVKNKKVYTPIYKK